MKSPRKFCWTAKMSTPARGCGLRGMGYELVEGHEVVERHDVVEGHEVVERHEVVEGHGV